MKIGIFGGTFNPIHIGHIRGAISVYETFELNRVIFIPTGIPPHKKNDVACAEHRYEMVKLSIANIDNFCVSRMEIDSNRVNYTIDTINLLKEQYKQDKLFFVVGTDAFYYFDLWKDYKKLIEKTSFILMRRPEYDITPIINKYGHMFEFENAADYLPVKIKRGRVYIYTPPAFDISSSMIREKIRKGQTIRYLVTEKVENFIKEKGLYKYER